jgi:ABC-type multidrug transport system fused ATPase/permease subunit
MSTGKLIDPQIIRMPLIMFPIVLSSLSTALVAVNRISKFLTAEELAEPYIVDESLTYAVNVDGDFTWEEAVNTKGSDQDNKAASDADTKMRKTGKKERIGRQDGKTTLPTTAAEGLEIPPDEGLKNDEKPFELKNLMITVQKGSFVAIVGQVGSGKVILVIVHTLQRLSHLSELCSSVLDW